MPTGSDNSCSPGCAKGRTTALPPRAARGPLRMSQHADFIQAAARLNVAVVLDEPMAPHCTFRIGGPAELYAAASDVRTLERLGDLAQEHGIPITVLGGGSNVLISDRGIRGLVIANQA